MKKFFIAALIALFYVAPASAQNALTFVALGYCQLTSLSASTALSACAGGLPASATIAVISVEGAPIRYRDDGTAPTTTIGMPVAIGQAFTYQSALMNLRIIQQSASASVNILFYR